MIQASVRGWLTRRHVIAYLKRVDLVQVFIFVDGIIQRFGFNMLFFKDVARNTYGFLVCFIVGISRCVNY